ncbi:MAG: TonB-dependent receptor, partial [Steroidobacteraceae bacterium]
MRQCPCAQHGRLTYLAGLYAYHSNETSDLAFGPFSLGRNQRSSGDYAAFLNADYALSQHFTLSAGVRYDDNTQRNYATSTFTSPLTQERSQKAVLPRYSVTYKPSDKVDIYGLVSRGYHAGGFNGATAPQPTYQSEFIWNYEIGVKGSFWDHRIQTQMDAFYLDWSHQQLNQTINVRQGVGISQITNAGESRISGEEAALQWAVSDSLDVDASLTFLDSKYKAYQDTVIAPRFGLNPDLNGKRLPFSPRAAGSLSVQYLASLPVGGGTWKARLRADVRYTDSRFFDPTDLLEASAYWLTNLYAGVQNERYEIGVYADNVFNQGYLTGGFLPDGVFPPEVELGQPR